MHSLALLVAFIWVLRGCPMCGVHMVCCCFHSLGWPDFIEQGGWMDFPPTEQVKASKEDFGSIPKGMGAPYAEQWSDVFIQAVA